MPFPRRNLELKARYADLDLAAERAQELGARDAGLEVQTDTYFRVPTGRLKLREIEGKETFLIGYVRPDQSSARHSNYHLVPVEDPAALKAALTDTLGVRGVVAKRRRIWLWENVRIHLDEVTGLGTFIEFEAVITSPAEEAAAPGQLDRLSHLLKINANDRLAPSYADLLNL
jgi:predicted adenylyl cyclase CyaB